MRGKKYSLLLAKSFGTAASDKGIGNENDGGGGSNRNTAPGTVVGVAEIGLSAYPLLSSYATDSYNENFKSTTNVLASIGVLAVDPHERRTGIASALLNAAESIVRLWNETHLYAAVEPDNIKALQFFQNYGYTPIMLDSGCQNIEEDKNSEKKMMVSVEVSERLKSFARPHFLLRKELDSYRDTGDIT